MKHYFYLTAFKYKVHMSNNYLLIYKTLITEILPNFYIFDQA